MPRWLVIVALALGLPAASSGHGVEHEVQRRGGSIAVRARYHGGKSLAGAAYQVLAPGEPPRIHAEGRTGPDGWLEFQPDLPGTWRVRIADASGHGGVFEIAVEDPAPPAHAPSNLAPAGTPFARVLRTGAAALAIVLAFAALQAVHRRRGIGR